jgi:hypothetical protein
MRVANQQINLRELAFEKFQDPPEVRVFVISDPEDLGHGAGDSEKHEL